VLYLDALNVGGDGPEKPGREIADFGGVPAPLFPLFVRCYHGRSETAGRSGAGRDAGRAGVSRRLLGGVKA